MRAPDASKMPGRTRIALVPEADEDRALVQRSADGDDEAFRTLMERYQGDIYNLALRYVGDPNLAEEITQDTFVRLFKSLTRLRFEATLGTWLHRVAVNACRDSWRTRQRDSRRVSLEVLPEGVELESLAPGPEQHLVAHEDHALVQTCLLELTHEQREVVVLRYVSGLSYAEISQTLGCSSGTVASRLHRAMKSLGERLAILNQEQIKQ